MKQKRDELSFAGLTTREKSHSSALTHWIAITTPCKPFGVYLYINTIYATVVEPPICSCTALSKSAGQIGLVRYAFTPSAFPF